MRIRVLFLLNLARLVLFAAEVLDKQLLVSKYSGMQGIG